VTVLIAPQSGRSVVRARVSSDPATDAGVLTRGVDLPPGQASQFSLIDPLTGGSDTDGAHTVYAQWQDSAGCWSEPLARSVTLDRQAPTGSLSVNEAPTSLTGTVGVVAPATGGLAPLTVELSNDGVTWSSFAASDQALTWSAGALPDGPWTISARWRDALGRLSSASTVDLLLDRHGPSGQLTINSGAPYATSGNVTLTGSATDAASAVTAVRVSNSATLSGGVLAQGQTLVAGAPISWQLPGASSSGGTADGAYTVYAQWQDAVGHWSALASASVRVDRTPPQVSGLIAEVGPDTTLGRSTVPVRLRWLVSDAGSGLASTAVEVSRNGGPWSVPAGASVTPTGSTFEVDAGVSWRGRVRAIDALGNVSANVTTPAVLPSVVEEKSALVRYAGRWTKVRASSASGGSLRYATAKSATATLTFDGRSVAWVTPRGTKFGKAKVLIDGVVVATVDLRATSTQSRRIVFARSWASSGRHTIRIKVLGTSGRPRVNLDCFVVLN
jgi:hypothetical protein